MTLQTGNVGRADRKNRGRKFDALCHAHLGNDREARKLLQLAKQEFDQKAANPSSNWFPGKSVKWQLYLHFAEKQLATSE